MIKNKIIALSVAASMLGGSIVAPAMASTKGRRNTTIALGAVTAYGLLKKKKKVAIVGGLGTAYAYHRYRKSKKSDWRREQDRIAWYKRYYGKNWYKHYVKGK